MDLADLAQADSGVVVPEYLLVGGAGLGHAESADLAEAHAMAPALARENEALHRSLGVGLAIDHEQVLPQPQPPADTQALQEEVAVLPPDLQLHHPPGDAEAPGHQVAHPAHVPIAGQALAQLEGGRPRAGPVLGPLDRKRHTSELQSPDHLVCRLLLEKKKINHTV